MHGNEVSASRLAIRSCFLIAITLCQAHRSQDELVTVRFFFGEVSSIAYSVLGNVLNALINSLDPHKHPMRLVLLLSHFTSDKFEVN